MGGSQALPPKEIKFAPLNKSQEYDGPGLIALYKVRYFGMGSEVELGISFVGLVFAGGQAPGQVLAHHRGLARLPHHLLEHTTSPQYAPDCA